MNFTIRVFTKIIAFLCVLSHVASSELYAASPEWKDISNDRRLNLFAFMSHEVETAIHCAAFDMKSDLHRAPLVVWGVMRLAGLAVAASVLRDNSLRHSTLGGIGFGVFSAISRYISKTEYDQFKKIEAEKQAYLEKREG